MELYVMAAKVQQQQAVCPLNLGEESSYRLLVFILQKKSWLARGVINTARCE